MNQEQFTSAFRTAGQIAGTLLTSYGIGNGEMWQSVFGALLVLILTGWSLYSNRTAGLVAKAGATSAVTAPITVSDPSVAASANRSAGSTVAVAR